MAVFVDDMRVESSFKITPRGGKKSRVLRGRWSNATASSAAELDAFALALRTAGFGGMFFALQRSHTIGKTLRLTDRARRAAIARGATPIEFGGVKWKQLFGLPF